MAQTNTMAQHDVEVEKQAATATHNEANRDELANAIEAEDHETSKLRCIRRNPRAFFWACYGAWQIMLLAYENNAAGLVTASLDSVATLDILRKKVANVYCRQGGRQHIVVVLSQRAFSLARYVTVTKQTQSSCCSSALGAACRLDWAQEDLRDCFHYLSRVHHYSGQSGQEHTSLRLI